MAETPVASSRVAAGRGSAAISGNLARWYGALDAMAPYLIAIVAIVIARHPFASTLPATLAVIAAAALLAVGAGAMFFWELPDAHRTWPVAFILFVLLAPFLALHAALEQSALNAPVPIHLLPLVFTWAGLGIAAAMIACCLYATAADRPGWAGVIVAPIAACFAAVAATSPDASRHAVLTALLVAFAVAEVAAGVGWLLPERYRWFLIPVVLATGALAAARIVFGTPHHLPGRWLLLGDAMLAAIVGMIALGSPLLSRWLTAAVAKPHPRPLSYGAIAHRSRKR
jgi:hypothetical protein